jgi:thiamine biosynthesis lipoprotein
VVVLLWGAALVADLRAAPASSRFEFGQTEMAVPIRIVLYAPDNATAAAAARAAFRRFHDLGAVCSDYDAASELRQLCEHSSPGKPIQVSTDLWRVLVRARELSQRSEGAFDVTVGPLTLLWRNARRTKELPSPASIAAAREKVGYRLMRLDAGRQTVELLKPGMRIDLGGIAKGYAVDEAMAAIRASGITRMMVEAGGNIGLGDPPPERSGWRIGIAPPDVGQPPRQYVLLARAAVSTSGDLWQHATIAGVRYSHHIDPKTGIPLTGRMSVTVVGPDGLSTDGLSSAALILGSEKGMKLIEATPQTAGLMVRLIDGKESVRESAKWKELPSK